MRQVIIGFSYNNGIFSRVIRALSNSSVSHCFVKIPLPLFASTGEFMVFHAAGMSVGYSHSSYFLKHSTVVEEYSVWMRDEQFAAMEAARIRLCGRPYGWWTIIGYLWVLIGLKFGRRWKNPLSDGDHTHICVELAAEQAGWNLGEVLETMTPEDLRTHASKNGILLSRRA